MSFLQKLINKMEKEITVGGTDNVPLTFCLRPAYASANTPACVECTGRVLTHKSDDIEPVRHAIENSAILFLELTA